MKHGGLFDQTRTAVEDYISEAKPCTLLVLGSFGITADVHDARFLATGKGRAKLISVLRGLRPTHTAANLDEAAKLVELLSYQLRTAYGASANRLIVRVYSDLGNRPSTGKPTFSLGEYLARRMDARYMRVSPGDNPGEQTLSLLAGEKTTEPATAPRPDAGKVFTPSAALAFSAVVLLLGGLALVLRRSAHSRNSRPRDGGLDALLVIETAVAAEGGVPVAVGPERSVPVAPGVPAVFSTDPNSATSIAAVVPNAPNGELFRIEPLAGGFIRVQSTHPRLTINGEPLDVDRRLRVDIREPITVRLGPRAFHIVGVFRRPRALERADELFDAEALLD